MIDAVLTLLRTSPTSAAHRAEVAFAAGVTPALLCYYFPDHAQLIETATKPVLDGYMRALLAILASGSDDDDKLRQVVQLLIQANLRDPHVIDAYIEVVRQREEASQIAYLLGGYEALATFIAGAHFSSINMSVEAGFLIFALWGLCRSVTQAAQLPVAMFESAAGAIDEVKLTDRVFALLGNHGAGFAGSMDPVSPGVARSIDGTRSPQAAMRRH